MSQQVEQKAIGARPNWRRFRFGLRSLFVLVTMLCIGLGLKFPSDRRAAYIETWDRALRNVICENIATVPNCLAVAKLMEQSPSIVATDKLWPNDEPAARPRKVNDILTSWAPNIVLDVSTALQLEQPAALANRLLKHYESGLAEHGLQRISFEPGMTCPTTTESSAVWVSDRPELNTFVTIAVRVSADTNQGNVQIRHVARPTTRSW